MFPKRLYQWVKPSSKEWSDTPRHFRANVIEEAFRDLKSHGWHLEGISLHTPQRVVNLWIILVVAYTWILLIGQALMTHGLIVVPKRRADGTYIRRWSSFREGWRWFIHTNPPLRI